MTEDSDQVPGEDPELTLERREKLVGDIEKAACRVLGTNSPERAMHLVNQLAPNVQDLKGDDENFVDRLAVALNAVVDFKPRDETERMLVTQMLSVHEASMECFRRAMMAGQTFEGRDMNLKHAERLTAIYARQVEALDKHRGKGKQKITVEHVNVHAGGQAIVGDVNAARAETLPAADASRQAPALTDESAAAEDGENLREALRAKKTPAVNRTRKR